MYYIAYGSNLNISQMAIRCPGSKPVGTAVLPDTRLVFRQCATIEPADGYKVPVAVWKVPKSDEASLDRYEGFPILYYKNNLTVTMTDITTARKRTVTAMVYIMTDRFPVEPPMQHYFDTVVRGYRDFGFDTDVLYTARMEANDAYRARRKVM